MFQYGENKKVARKATGLGAVVAIVVTLLGALLSSGAFAAGIPLAWTPSTDPDLAGYKVYYQANSPTLPFTNATPIDVGNVTSTVIEGLDPNTTYYFAVTVYNSGGLESDFSNVIEVLESVPPVATLTSPAAGATLRGVVSLSAAVSDNVGVSSVAFFANGSQIAQVTAAPYTYAWDVSSLPNGNYTLVAKAFDAAGNEGDSAPVAVSINGDVTPPTVGFTSPASGATVGGSVTVGVSAQDDVAVTKLDLFLDGALVQTGNVAPASYTWSTVSSSNGSHTLVARAYDAAGNVGETSLTVTVFNDTQAPAVSVIGPTSGSTLGQSTTVLVSATDNVGVVKVEYYLDGVLQSTATSLPYNFSWNTLTSANGSHTLTAKAYDAAGNVGQSAGVAVTVFNDTVAPTVAIASPSAGSTLSQTATVQISASDNVGVTKVEYYLNGILQGTATASPYSFTWNTLTAVNGSYTLTAKAYDAAGNVGSSTPVTVSVFNDLQAPAVGSFTLPANANSTTVAVSALVASDNVGVTGYLITESATAPSAAATGWKASAPTSFSFAGTGLRTAYAWAKDAAGNVSSAKSASVLIDTTLPTIKSMSLSRSSGTVNVKASATDNVGVTRFQLYLDGVLKVEVASGSLSSTLTVSSGSHTATVKAYDAAGNTRSQSVNFYR